MTFTLSYSDSIVHYEQVNVCWVAINTLTWHVYNVTVCQGVVV